MPAARWIDGQSPDRIARLGITRTYQNIRLFANMSAIENILVGMEPQLKRGWFEAVIGSKGMREEEARAVEEANSLLQFVGLVRFYDSSCSLHQLLLSMDLENIQIQSIQRHEPHHNQQRHPLPSQPRLIL